MARRMIIGGLFTRIDGAECNANLEVLDASTGAVLSESVGGGFNGPVTAMCIDAAAERIYVAGCFNKYRGATVPAGLVRLYFDLSRDTDFAPPDFYVSVTSAYPVPTQLFVSGNHVYAVASNTYATFQKNIKDRRTFGFPINHFSTSWQDNAYWGPQMVRFAKSNGAIDTSWKTNDWTWNESDTEDRWICQAACAHSSGAVIVSVAQASGGSAGALLLLDAADCSTLHAIDSTVAFTGMQPGVAVDVVTLPNGSVIIIHQDAASGELFAFRSDEGTLFDEFPKQGAMFHVLQVVANKFVVDTGFTTASKWGFQVLGQDKYGLADIPYRLGKELIATSPIITTLPYLAGDSAYFGKWGTEAGGNQLGMVFWHGDPHDSSRCWDTHNGTFEGTDWAEHGFFSEACPLGETWVDTVAAYPLATWGSALESLDDGDLEPGVGVYVGGPVKAFKNVGLKSLCATQTLSIDGGSIQQDFFQYYPFFKVTALGEIDATFAQHLFEYQEADGDQLADLETGIPDRLYCGRVLCAELFPVESGDLISESTLIPHPPNWGKPVEIERVWQSQIADALTSAEARSAWRNRPLRSLRFTVTSLNIDERIQLEERVMAALKTGKAIVPYWGRSSVLASTASGTGATIQASAWPWQDGDWVFFMDELRRWDLVQIASIATNTFTLETALSRSYPAGSLIWPVLLGKLACSTERALTNHHGEIGLTLTETDPATSRPESSCPAVTSYRSRPVFPFTLNWAADVTKSFRFDLRDIQVGFGRTEFAPTQSHVVQGFESALILEGDTAVKAWDCFTQTSSGRLQGFWLSGPSAGLQILQLGAAQDRFYIRNIGLTQSWQLHPDQHLCFTADHVAPQFAKIQAVTDLGDGRELVVMDATLSFTTSSQIQRLHYVRLADDVERAVFLAENIQRRVVRVVELPHEYAAAETGTKPVFLYRFWIEPPEGDRTWYFTSHGADVTSHGQVYTSKPITHGEIRRSVRSDREEVRIEAFRESDHPLALLWPFRLSLPLWVEILETTVPAPNTTSTIFLGQVERAPVTGNKIVASCASLLDALNAQAMRFTIGPKCNHKFFSTACGVTKASFVEAASISSISADGRTVGVTGAGLAGRAANWFADGWIELGTGAEFQLATILKSSAASGTTVTLTLNWPLHSAGLTHPASVVAGCDGRFATCGTKFSNTVNFGGHPRVPIDNPTLPQLSVGTGGGKK